MVKAKSSGLVIKNALGQADDSFFFQGGTLEKQHQHDWLKPEKSFACTAEYRLVKTCLWVTFVSR